METKETLTAAFEELRDRIALHIEYLDTMPLQMQGALYDADLGGLVEILRRLDEFMEIKLCK